MEQKQNQLLSQAMAEETLPQADKLKALSDKWRLQIIAILLQQPEQEIIDSHEEITTRIPVGKIAEALRIEQATVSFHIGKLKKAGFISEESQVAKRSGSNTSFYSINKKTIRDVAEFLLSLIGENLPNDENDH